jgi:hypothetical protein
MGRNLKPEHAAVLRGILAGKSPKCAAMDANLRSGYGYLVARKHKLTARHVTGAEWETILENRKNHGMA